MTSRLASTLPISPLSTDADSEKSVGGLGRPSAVFTERVPTVRQSSVFVCFGIGN